MSKLIESSEVSLKALPDYIKEDLDMIVVGLNPSLTSAQIGHYFAGPGNHFWSCVTEVGLVSEPVTCYDDCRMIDYGIGFTNACSRATKGAADLSKKELKDGMKHLLSKLQQYTPKIVVFNGKGSYEIFVHHKHFGMGKQPQRLEGTNSVVFVMPSSSARCAQLPRAADKIPFFSALKDLRDKIKIWSNGLSTGGRLIPLEETTNTSMFPDQIDLELTRLYDAGKSNYSTDRAEKKRKVNNGNNGSHRNVKTSNIEDTSQGLTPGINNAQQVSKSKNNSRSKDEHLLPSTNINLSIPNQSPKHDQWVTDSFYNSSFSYQQYLSESSLQYSSSNFCRYPSIRSNIHPSVIKNYANEPSIKNTFSNLDERTENTFKNALFQDCNTNNIFYNEKRAEHKDNSKENYNSLQQASTNFVSLLMSDSLSVPGSPSEIEKTIDSRFNPSFNTMNWSIDSIQCNPQTSFWEHNNNCLASSYFVSRRPLPQDQPMSSVLSNFQSNYDEFQNENNYESPFLTSDFFATSTSINNSGSSHSPLSSDQVTSSLCSVKVAPDSTSLSGQKRYFNGPNYISMSNKVHVMDDPYKHTSDHLSLTYTDL